MYGGTFTLSDLGLVPSVHKKLMVYPSYSHDHFYPYFMHWGILLKHDNIEFDNNDPCIDLILEQMGILDEFSTGPRKRTNQELLERFSAKFGGPTPGTAKDGQGILSHPERRLKKTQFYGKLRPNKFRTDSTDFVIAHYAGDVQYSVCRDNLNDPSVDPETAGFLEKNKDKMVDLFVTLVQNSGLGYLSSLFAQHKATKTVAFIFRTSLKSLITKLRSTIPFFIRCVKPNPDKKARRFVNDMVLAQLRAAGMLETINIRNAGYPQRMTPDKFMKRYKLIVQLLEDISDATPPEEATAAILDWVHAKYADDFGPTPWHMGTTMVFMKERLLRCLEAERADAKAKIDAIKKVGLEHLQALHRMWLARRKLPRLVEEYKRNEKRIERIRELVAQGHSLEEAKKILAAEEEAERKAREDAERETVLEPIAAVANPALRDVDELLETLKRVAQGSHDPAQVKDVKARVAALAKSAKLAAEGIAKLSAGTVFRDEGTVTRVTKLVSNLEDLVQVERKAAPASEEEMHAFIEEEARRKAEEERRRKEEEARIAAERARRARARVLADKLRQDAKARAQRERAARKAEIARVLAARKRKAEMEAAVKIEQERIQRTINAARAEHERLEREREELLAQKKKMDEDAARARAAAEKQAAQQRTIQAKKERIAQKQAKRRARVEEAKEFAKTEVLRGTRVLWKGKRATIRYCGRLPIADSDDVWLGLEMDKKLKNGIGNDGSCLGVQFFVCAAGRGLFVRSERVSVVRTDVSKDVGVRVVAKGQRGTIRYVGEVYGQDGTWVGIELDKVGCGKNDGMAHEHRYFTCPPKTGIFMRPDAVDVVEPWSDEAVHAKLLDYCVENNMLSDSDLRELIRRTREEMADTHGAPGAAASAKPTK